MGRRRLPRKCRHHRRRRPAQTRGRPTALPEASTATHESDEKLHARSVTLSSERLRVIATLDLVEAQGQTATPVDYKHGAPRDGKDGLEMWPTDRVQIALQAIVLRENGYQCDEVVVFYQKTRQRVRVPVDDALIAEAEEAVARAWALAAHGWIPAPLEDSAKCVGCSLNSICLPDETNSLIANGLDAATQLGLFDPETPARRPPASEGLPNESKPEIRRLMTPRDDLRPLYLNTQGLRVGKSGEVLRIRDKDKVVQEARIGEINQVTASSTIQRSGEQIPRPIGRGLIEAARVSGEPLLAKRNDFVRTDLRMADHGSDGLSTPKPIRKRRIEAILFQYRFQDHLALESSCVSGSSCIG